MDFPHFAHFPQAHKHAQAHCCEPDLRDVLQTARGGSLKIEINLDEFRHHPPPVRSTPSLWGENPRRHSVSAASHARAKALSPAWRFEPWSTPRSEERQFQKRGLDEGRHRRAEVAPLTR